MELTSEYLDAVDKITIVCNECECEITGDWNACDGDVVIRLDAHKCTPNAKESTKQTTNMPSDEISICRGGDGICEFKSVSYRCCNPEWCSYKLKLSHVG